MNSAKKILNQQKADEKKTQSKVATPAKTSISGGDGGASNKKAIVLSAICVVLVIVLCVGVGIQQLKPRVAVTINDTKISMDDMMYPIYETESSYSSLDAMYQMYMGTSVWEATYSGDDTGVGAGSTNSEGLKIEIMNNEIEYEILYQEAVKADYTLTEDEKSEAQKQAEEALKGLSWGQKLQLAISKDKLVKRFEKRALANRYKEDQQTELNKSVDEDEAIKDISAKDYRQYDLEYYSVALTNYDDNGDPVELTEKEKKKYAKEMKQLAKDAKDAKDFSELLGEADTMISYDTSDFTEQDGWPYLSDANLKKVKKLNNGEVSEAFIDDETGYYVVVKMVDNNSTESYDTACEEAVSEAQDAAYQTWYTELFGTYSVTQNSEIWDDVVIGTVTTDIVTVEDLEKMAEEASSGASSGATSETE